VSTSRESLAIDDGPVATALNQGGLLLQLLTGGAAQSTEKDRLEDSQYRQFLEALGVAVYTTDAAGRITYF
jgi:PAS domain-containing protein